MNIKKNLRSILNTGTVLALLMLGVGAFIARPAAVLADNVEPGSSGSISVSVSGTNLGSFTISVSCDSSVIHFTSLSPGSLCSASNFSDGSADMSWFSMTTPSSGGSVATIGYTVVGAPGSSTSIDGGGSFFDFPDGNPTSGSVSVSPDFIQVNEPPPTTTTEPPTTTTEPPTTTTDTTPKFDLQIMVNGQGTTIPAPGQYSFDEGSRVDLEAQPAAGWKFDNWTGLVNDPNSIRAYIIMNESSQVTANFSEIGQTTTPPTTTTTTPTTTTTSPTTTTTSPTTTTTGPPTTSEEPPTTTTEAPTTTPTTTAPQFYTLTVVIEGSGITAPGAGPHQYAPGTVVNVEASPASGWRFNLWSGGVANPVAPGTTITMNADKMVTARFTEIPVDSDGVPPAVSGISAGSVGRSSAVIAWQTDEPSDSQVEYWASPSQLSPLDATMATDHQIRLEGLSPVTEYHFRVMSRDAAGNLKVSAEQTFSTIGNPAAFAKSEWSLTVDAGGTKATLQYKVTNTGDIAGQYQETCLLDGNAVGYNTASLGPGEGKFVSFEINDVVAGEHAVTLGGFEMNFSAGEAASPAPGFGLLLGGQQLWYVVFIALLLISGAGVFFWGKKQGYWAQPAVQPWYPPPTQPQTAPAASATTTSAAAPTSSADMGAKTLADRLRGVSSFEGSAPRAADIPAHQAAPQPIADIEIGMNGGMFTVSGLAAEKLGEILKKRAAAEDMSFRIDRNGESKELSMTLGGIKTGDYTVRRNGRVILSVSNTAAELLSGIVLHYKQKEGRDSFTLDPKE